MFSGPNRWFILDEDSDHPIHTRPLLSVEFTVQGLGEALMSWSQLGIRKRTHRFGGRVCISEFDTNRTPE